MAKDPFRVTGEAAKALKTLRARKKAKFQVVGRVTGGKLQINKGRLRAFTKRMAEKDVYFVALNAPFKTRPLIGSV